MQLNEILKNVPLFSKLSDKQLNQIILSGSVCSYDAGHILFNENDYAESLYVIIDGLVKIYKRNSEGQEVQLNTKSKGDFFGELSLIDGDRRSATVAAEEPSDIFVLKRAEFNKILTNSPQALSYILTLLVKDIRTASEKRFQEELSRQKLQSEMEMQRYRAISQMVAGVAHEVNTPLGIIKTAADLMNKYLSPELIEYCAKNDQFTEAIQDASEAATLIQANIDRAQILIEGFKETSFSQITCTKEKVSFTKTVKEIVGLYRLDAKKTGISIEVSTTLNDNFNWLGFPGFLSQVILNLLSNISRYAYPDGVGGKVEITIGEDSNKDIPVFTIDIRDFGCGIPSKSLSHVFDAFFTTGRDKGGTGLGMAIVHNLVTQALQGQITIKSESGDGTTVSLRLPQQVSDEAQD